MQMLYNSESYAVVQFDVPAEASAATSIQPAGQQGLHANEGLTRGGYEIVDKFARKEIFIEGALAESFKEGVEALIETQPSEEEIDDYLGRFTSLMHQPVVLH
jgi:hypothetical protein